MFGWFRRRKKAAETPAVTPRAVTPRKGETQHWASWWTLEQQGAFEAIVLRYFVEQGLQSEIDDGAVTAAQQCYGLSNLAQYCRAMPVEEWPLAVEQHFENLKLSEDESEEWSARNHDYAWARERIHVRLYPSDLVQPDGLVSRRDLEETQTMLVADLPSIVVSVGVEDLKAWGKDEATVFSEGLKRTTGNYPVEVHWQQVLDEPAIRIATLTADHLFVATHALDLERRTGLHGPHGCLVAVPHRHLVLAYPIHNIDLIHATKSMAQIAIDYFNRGPGSVSPHLYWRKPGGDMSMQAVEAEGEGLNFYPSDDFTELLNRLEEASRE